jgi:hypothetical protein
MVFLRVAAVDYTPDAIVCCCTALLSLVPTCHKTLPRSLRALRVRRLHNIKQEDI